MRDIYLRQKHNYNNASKVSSIALATALFWASQPAFAQETANETVDETIEETAEDDVIVVQGFRASIQNSIAAKRSLTFIADVISADDIAGLPDVSIAESLARLPGVTSQRTGGQASAINIRGLSQDLVSATLNGREQVSTSGNRTIEFDQYPSELISQAAVYKTPIASIIEGGIAGLVELKTVRPLDNSDDLKATLNVRGLYNDRANQSPDVSSEGYRVSASVQAKLLDDTLGLALGYARLSQPNVATRFVQFDFPFPGTNGSPSVDLNGDGQFDSLNFGFEAIQFGGREERDGVIGVIQYEPTSNLRILLDGYYSQFDSSVRRRGYRAFATQSGDNIITDPVIAGTALIGGVITNNVGSNGFGFGAGVELVNQDEGRQDELYTLGGNIAYDFGSKFTAALDVSYSRGTSFFNNSGINIRPFENVPVTEDNPRGLQRTDSIAGLISINSLLNGLDLPTINGITNGGVPIDFTNFSEGGGGFLLDGQFLVPQADTDELFAIAADFEYRPDSGFIKSIKFGGRYSSRNGQRTITSFNTFGVPGSPLVIPSNLIQNAGFEGGFANAGLVDFGVVDIGGAFDFAFGGNFGVNQPDVGQDIFDFTIDQSFGIDEDVYAGYTQLDFETIAGALPFRGNLGLRVVYTDQSSTVFAQDPNLPNDPASTIDNRILLTNGDEYVDFLPSANLILDVTDNSLLRLSYTRQISRPRFVDLNGSVSVNTGADGNTTGGGGNPSLQPFEANQFDLSYERYFNSSSILSIAAFYKDLRSFIIGGTIPTFNFVEAGLTPPPIPGTMTPGNAVGSFSAPVNGDGGFVWGFELNLTYSFDELLPAPFDGFGVILNYAYSNSDLDITSSTSGQNINLTLPGLSESVANPTLYYEKNGFGARLGARYRTSFVSPQIGISELVVSSGSELVFDTQVSYEFDDKSPLSGIKLLFQVNNLTDEETRTFFGQRAQTGTIQNFGRTFFLGATAQF